MSRLKAPPWTAEEIAILTDVYPREGIGGAADALPDRTWRAIYIVASRLKLRSPIVGKAPQPPLKGEPLERAIVLREEHGWSFAKIGAELGFCEASVCNAVLIALCPRKGFKPAPRDANGKLTDEGLERLRLMLRKGLKGVDIQLRLGVSAACVAEQRRRYRADLKARGKAALPAPGGGEAYSGVKLSAVAKREVEQLLREGHGAGKISKRTGVSNTSIGRIRNRLIKRLARKGETLTGCDLAGKRVSVRDHAASIPATDIERLKTLLMEGTPVARAARMANMGSCSAYRIRDELKADLASRGEELPPIKRLGRRRAGAADARANWLPIGRVNLVLYRTMLRDAGGDEIDARRRTVRAIALRDGQDPHLAEQLDRMKRGAVFSARFTPRRPDPSMTLGGVASGAL